MAVSEQCTLPLDSLSEVLSWTPTNFSPPVRRTRTVSDDKNVKRPRVLLCHDMKGGYLADRFDFGCYSPDQDGFGFSFWNWLSVDIFVYFSHKFVTIPPRSWIEVAKANGVKVLGTFITEFDSGERIWTNELNMPLIIDQLVDKLVEITVHHGFDGWLLNIENKVCQQVHLVQRLIGKLSAKIHEAVDGGLVIWYDSVTYPDGKLKWQNELNAKNEPFFDSCDGIFLNYTWTPENLNKSLELARKRDRQFDVFVGVDVFGRNCFGGGGFNTRLAVEKAVRANLSVAIFAFGWVFETLPFDDFLKNQQKFWNLLHDLLPTNKKYLVPFSTVFSTSYGKELFWLGEKCIGKGPWYCLSLQSPCQTLAVGSNCSISSDYEAFIGSSCLEVTIDAADQVKLFPIRFSNEGDFQLCVGYKWIRLFDESNASLEVTDRHNEPLCSIVLRRNDDKWCLDSTLFHSSCQDGFIKITSSGFSSRVLIGYIGIFEACKQTIDFNETTELIKVHHVDLHDALFR